MRAVPLVSLPTSPAKARVPRVGKRCLPCPRAAGTPQKRQSQSVAVALCRGSSTRRSFGPGGSMPLEPLLRKSRTTSRGPSIVELSPRGVLYARIAICEYMPNRDQFAEADKIYPLYLSEPVAVEINSFCWYQYTDLAVVPFVASSFFQQFTEKFMYRIISIT